MAGFQLPFLHSAQATARGPWEEPGPEHALPSVLQDVSFTLHPGKVTALVGPSGSGKSSCVNILENFYPLQDGQVLLDGRPITMYDHKYLHSVVRATDKCILAIACHDQRGWMVALHVALDVIWQLLKCPESWRLEMVQEMNSNNLWGWKGKGMESGFIGRGKSSENKARNMFCFVFFGQHSRNMFLVVGLIIV